MPGKADSRLKILRGRRQRLAVIAQTEIQRKVRLHMKGVLHKSREQPLRQLIAADPEVNRLLIILNIGQRQLIERQSTAGARAEESEGTEDRCAWFAAAAARGVMQHAAAKFEIMRAARPGHGIGKLELMTPEIRKTRLANCERYRAGTRVIGRDRRRAPERYRITV